MDLKDIKVFLKVFEYQNMSKAAKDLYLSTQSVSSTISKLEETFNVRLFERTPTGSIPTKESYLLKSNAQKIIDDFESLNRTFSGTKEHKKIVKIATTTGIFRYVTLQFINDFYESYPYIKLEITEQPDSAVDELCWNEAVDIAFNSAPINHLKFESFPFSSHKYCLVLHRSHPLANKALISYKDLEGYPLAIQRSFNYHINKLYQANFTPNIIFETTDISFLNEIAECNHAIGISIDYVAAPFLGKNSVIRYFEDDMCTWDSLIIIKKGKNLSPETKLFLEYTLDWKNKKQ